MVSAVPISNLNLDRCAQEPIRIPGSIQPHGTLVVMDADSRRIVQASANATTLLAQKNDRDRGESVLGLSLRQLVGEAAERQITEWLSNPDSGYLRTLSINGERLQVIGHHTAQGVILEFEQPPASEGETLEAYYPRIGRFMEDVPAYESLAELCTAAAREFRQISGFNRILVYRFDEQWNGEVLAEDGDGVLPSYAGLRFPASDIPAQARELYRLNRLRLIPDANYVPVPIEAAAHPHDGKPLDLSFAALRSVSPVHLQYMRNMGTLASMSISVLVDGKLWGLVSCHNAAPRRVNAQARTACDLLGKVLSQHIGARERGAYSAKRIELKRIESELLTSIAATESFQSGLAANAAIWLKIANAGGAAILHDDAIFTAGATPSPARLRALTEKLQQAGSESFVYVAINVRDTGVGMPPEVVARAFEPFFTTKSVGQGTGLGLSQVYGFVRQSGGQVRISSTATSGTTIRIYLPAARPDAELPTDEHQPETTVIAQRETILVVEDDPDVRAFTVETVRELGYDVLEARDGINALSVLRQTPVGDIDLLFSDVVLPGGLNGQQLAQQAVVLHPQLKVLFATGYARDVIVHHGRLDPGVELITKPFAFHDLATRIRSVLDGQDSPRHAT